MEYWLRGGWAIDFLLGEVTRPHEDIDVVTWIQHRERLEATLEQAGYERIAVREQFRNRQSDFQKNGVEITFGYIIHSSDGSIIMNELPEWIWRPESLLSERFTLHGISAHVLHPTQLLEEKEVYEQIGHTPRLKDVKSKEVLRKIISNLR
jgi:hypothetical protein